MGPRDSQKAHSNLCFSCVFSFRSSLGSFKTLENTSLFQSNGRRYMCFCAYLCTSTFENTSLFEYGTSKHTCFCLFMHFECSSICTNIRVYGQLFLLKSSFELFKHLKTRVFLTRLGEATSKHTCFYVFSSIVLNINVFQELRDFWSICSS